MKSIDRTTAAVALLTLGGCVTMPTGPSVMVIPGQGKSYEQFRAEQLQCQQYAQEAIGGAAQTTRDNAISNTAVGTVVGVVAGTLIGAASGKAGVGAAIGAGGGLLMGSAAGAHGNYSMQQRYDMTYSQCMYSKGNQIQMPAQTTTYTYPPRRSYYLTPPPSSPLPPPPPGYYAPPPPPGTY